jgi:hypothetical protein
MPGLGDVDVGTDESAPFELSAVKLRSFRLGGEGLSRKAA